MRRVLITAADAPLPAALAITWANRSDVETVVLAGSKRPDSQADAETIRLGEGYADIRDAIWDHEIDTVIHGALAPDRLGDCSRLRGADIIATMQVAAVAADLDGPVRNLVAISSTMRYPARAGAAQFHDERHELLLPPDGGHAASLAEAEDYLIALADQRPNLSVCVLRLADLTGPSVTSPLASLLSNRICPKYIGFDPLVQFLHVDDAVAAIDHSVEHDLAGLFNVASRGMVSWSSAIRASGSTALPLLPPTLDPFVGIRRMLRFDPVPKGLARTLQFGRVAATDHLEAAGFIGRHTAYECVSAL